MSMEGGTLAGMSYMLQPMFDQVMVKGEEGAIWLVATVIFFLFLIRGVTGLIHRTILAKVSFNSSTQMQEDLLGHTLNLDNNFHSKSSPGSLIEKVQGDVVAIQNLWSTIFVNAGRDVITLAALISVAISIDWKWTLVTVMGAPLLLLPSLAVQRYVRRKSGYLRNIAADRTLRLDEIFHGVTPIKLNRIEGYQLSRFSELSKEWVKTTVKSVAGQASIPALIDLAVGFGFFCVLIYGAPQIISGEKTIGQFMSFFTAMGLAFQPMRSLGNVLSSWQVMAASLVRIFDLFDTKPTIANSANVTTEKPSNFEIKFKNVCLNYSSSPILKNLSFTALEGKMTAIVGQSGAGKSTVFNTMTRLFDPESGQITVGNIETKKFTIEYLRGLFSVVSQEALLFDETLLENILLGQKKISQKKLRAALDDSNVSTFLESLPDGVNTKVGPRGSNLSGGQRQRVAIARALLRDSPILLLDEATSALDAESEKLVQEALERLSKGKTTLVIAHRLSTITQADTILVLDSGCLVESGSHEELIKMNGTYSSLYKIQSGATHDLDANKFKKHNTSLISISGGGVKKLSEDTLISDLSNPNWVQSFLISLAKKLKF